MKKAIILAIVVSIFFACNASAAINYSKSGEDVLSQIFDKKGELSSDGKSLVEQANKQLEKLPSSVRSLIGSERIEVRLKLETKEEKIISVETKNAKIVSERLARPSNPTITVSTTEAAIRKIVQSKNRYAETKSAIKSNAISIRGNSWGAKIKVLVLKAFLDSGAFRKFTGRVLFLLFPR